ncbi:hypothetical protein BE11_41255 [Sorangium cellulosum]|nr:hypothetical protein BE11_41255 [Sorangium cellulosum]
MRESVQVQFVGDKVQIAYALWQVELPAAWVRSRPLLCDLLERKRTGADLVADREIASLVRLLHAQGCFAPQPKAAYSLREIRSLFAPVRSMWYAAYYAHPVWERLRTGAASHNELLAWLIHNYHVSRAAGVVGARMAAMGRDANLRAFFESDALDEYWHCDAYYFIDTPALRVSADDVKSYVRLPSSLAFEEHALQVAEADPLGHLLIAYFQESSIAFERDSNDFYGSVEAAYGIPGFFDSWKRHIRIDVEHRHAEGLERLFDSDRMVDAETVAASMQNAWIAFSFLCSSLKEIRGEERSGADVLLRLPIRGGALHGARTALVRNTSIESSHQARVFADLRSLIGWYGKATTGPAQAIRLESDGPYLRDGLVRSAFRALGFARDHDQIIVCGRLASLLSRDAPRPVAPPGPFSVAVVNHLLEAACDPVSWAILAEILIRRMEALGPSDPCWPARLRQERTSTIDKLLGAITLTPDESDRWLTKVLLFDDLIARWSEESDVVPQNVLGD